MMAKSNRKTLHFAHEILAVQRKKCGLGMRLNLYNYFVNAMHSETDMKAHNNIKVTLTRFWSFQWNVRDTL